MAFSSFSWPFRRQSDGGGGGSSKSATAADEDEELGVTPQLLDFLRSISADTFKSSAQLLHGGSEEEATASDLTHWQERHAVLVLSKAKELSKIRYDLCPRHMKDKQFWRIYFLLAKSHIAPYELRAIQIEKLRRMETENGKPRDVITVEVEMQESKSSGDTQTLPVDSESQDS